MGIRYLTDEELEQIKVAKQSASEKLKESRHALQLRRKYVTGERRRELDRQINSLSPPSGKPVIVVVEGQEIYIDYEMLKKFIKLLDRQKFWYSLNVEGLDSNRKLTIQYHQSYPGTGHGNATLYEIPPRKRDLLQGLPKIELLRVN